MKSRTWKFEMQDKESRMQYITKMVQDIENIRNK